MKEKQAKLEEKRIGQKVRYLQKLHFNIQKGYSGFTDREREKKYPPNTETFPNYTILLLFFASFIVIIYQTSFPLLLINQCLYNIKMTDIHHIPQHLQSLSHCHFQQIHSLMEENQLIYSSNSVDLLTCILPFPFLSNSSKILPFYSYNLVLSIQLDEKILFLRGAILNERGLEAKSKSFNQTNLLLKYSMVLNTKNEVFQIKTHPITGQIEINFSIWIGDYKNLREVIYQSLNSLKQKNQIIVKVLEIIEEVPIETEQNEIYHKTLNKIESVRSMLCGDLPLVKKNSAEQRDHEKYFFVQEPSKANYKSSNSLNMIEKLRKTCVDQPLSLFSQNSIKAKKSNFSYIGLQMNEELGKVLKCIEEKNMLPKNQWQTGVFNNEGNKIYMQYESEFQENINYQYSIAEDISKTKTYYPFIKQYLVVRNHLSLNRYYVLSKKQNCQTEELSQFINKNRLTISFATKMKILQNILSISCICLERIRDFSPNLLLHNFQIDKHLNLKLKSLNKSEINSKACLLQSCYRVLVGEKYYVMKQRKTMKKERISIQNQKLETAGPSELVKIILKCLQVFQERMQDSKSVENLLFMINRVYDSYQNIFNWIQYEEQLY